jgi:hypothetical protein
MPSATTPTVSTVSTFLGAGLAHRFAAQPDAMGIVHEAVEDAVGDCDIADLLVPSGDGKLRGHDRRAQRVSRLCPRFTGSS